MAQYGKLEYWEDRYTKDLEQFDWYQKYSGVKDIITQYLKHDDNILMVGCGNGKFSEHMYEDGFQNITNVDYSQKVIEQMTLRYKEKFPGLVFKQVDCRNMSYIGNGLFDAVIDKACFDAILSGDSSSPNSDQFLKEIHRVLSNSGVYINISHGEPEQRIGYFEKKDVFSWGNNVIIQKASKPYIRTSKIITDGKSDDNKNFHFLYICQKQE